MPDRVRTGARRGWPLVVVGLIALIAFMHADSRLYFTGGSALFALLVALLLLVLEIEPHSRPARLLSLRPVVWIGTISYGLYLWHWPLVVWLNDPSVAINYHVKEALQVGGTFLIATLSSTSSSDRSDAATPSGSATRRCASPPLSASSRSS